MKKTLLFLIILLTTSLMASAAGSVRLHVESASGDNRIGVGDLFYIIYTVKNIDAEPQQPASVPGARVAYFTLSSQNSSFSSINGQTTQSRTAVYTLTARAQKEGSFSFGPVTVGGVKSNSVSYKIGATSSSSSSSSSQSNSSSYDDADADADSGQPKFIGKGDNNLFLLASVSKTSAYEQEALVYTLKLYTTYSAVKFIGATSAPKFEGFVVEESKAVSTQFSYEKYQGKTYATAVIARYIIFPQMTGRLNVLGNTYTISVDRAEYYHDPFWGRMQVNQPMQVNVKPNDLVVNVNELPQPRPANFSGGVGNFKITASMPDRSLLTNQAASVVYTVSGNGNLKYVKLPELSTIYPSQFEVYSPTTNVQTNVGADNVSGSVRFDYSVMPLEEGDFTLPAVELVFFNPSTGKYETVKSTGFNVKVGKGKASSKSQRREKLAFNPKLMPMTQSLSKTPTLYPCTWLYWVLFALPLVVLIAAVIIYRRYLKLNSDIWDVRSRKAGKMARRRLRQAYACMRRGDRQHFYEEMLKALWGYVGDKLSMPTSELSRENVREEMLGHNIDEAAVNEVIKLLDDCEFARYAPASDDNDMQKIYDSAVATINNVENTINKNKQAN